MDGCCMHVLHAEVHSGVSWEGFLSFVLCSQGRSLHVQPSGAARHWYRLLSLLLALPLLFVPFLLSAS